MYIGRGTQQAKNGKLAGKFRTNLPIKVIFHYTRIYLNILRRRRNWWHIKFQLKLFETDSYLQFYIYTIHCSDKSFQSENNT